MIIRIVRLTFRQECIEDFLDNFERTKALIRAFEGCQHLELWRDADNPNIFCTCSHWQSIEALNAYRDSALFNEVWTFTKTLFADKPQAFSVSQWAVLE